MPTIQISKRHQEMLEELAANYYVIPGKRPKSVNKVVEVLIEEKYSNYDPPEYQTPGFDRQ